MYAYDMTRHTSGWQVGHGRPELQQALPLVGPVLGEELREHVDGVLLVLLPASDSAARDRARCHAEQSAEARGGL